MNQSEKDRSFKKYAHDASSRVVKTVSTSAVLGAAAGLGTYGAIVKSGDLRVAGIAAGVISGVGIIAFARKEVNKIRSVNQSTYWRGYHDGQEQNKREIENTASLSHSRVKAIFSRKL